MLKLPPTGNRGSIHRIEWPAAALTRAARLIALAAVGSACIPAAQAQATQTQMDPDAALSLTDPSLGTAPPSLAASISPASIQQFRFDETSSFFQAPQQQTPPPQTPQQPATPAGDSSGQQPAGSGTVPDAPKPANAVGNNQPSVYDCKAKPCQIPVINWYLRFEDGPQVKPLTPKEKGWLATRNLIDPFNIITILGEAGISVAANSHSPYGPGFPGWGRYVGVSFTEDITGEFFGTFLIPSIVHQDPHYHRMPQASYKRRIFHAAFQVLWTESDSAKGMLNYANLIGFGIDDEIANLYVPGRQTNARATADRYGIALLSAPIGNYITEFLPDVARHIHVQVVIVQRIINQIAEKNSNGT